MPRITPELLKSCIAGRLAQSATAEQEDEAAWRDADLLAIQGDEQFLSEAFRRILGRDIELDAFLHFSQILKDHPRRFIVDCLYEAEVAARHARNGDRPVEAALLLKIESDIAFIRAAYLNVLGRAAQPASIEFYRAEMRAGASRAAVLSRIAGCPEARRQGVRVTVHGEPIDNPSPALSASGPPAPVVSPIEVSDLLAIAPTDEFARAAHLRILGREAEPAALEHWLRRLEDGLPRTQLLLFFAGSAEAPAACRIQGVALEIAARILAAARPALEPEPDIEAAALNGLRAALDELAPAPTPAAAPPPIEIGDLVFLASDAGFVAEVYTRMLGREADPGGLAHHQQHLASGLSRTELLLEFARCPEASAAGYTFCGIPLKLAANVLGRAAAPPAAGEEPQDSTELATLDSILDLGHFVFESYRRILARQPDFDGFASYWDLLRFGVARRHIVARMATSPEALGRGVPLTWGGQPLAAPGAAPFAVRVRLLLHRLLGATAEAAVQYSLCALRAEQLRHDRELQTTVARQDAALAAQRQIAEGTCSLLTSVTREFRGVLARVESVQRNQARRLVDLTVAAHRVSSSVRALQARLIESARELLIANAATRGAISASIESAATTTRSAHEGIIGWLERHALRAEQFSAQLDARHAGVLDQMAADRLETGHSLQALVSKLDAVWLDLQIRQDAIRAGIEGQQDTVSAALAVQAVQLNGLLSTLDEHEALQRRSAAMLTQKLDAIAGDGQVRQEAILRNLEESARAAEVAHGETSQSAAILAQKLDAIAGDGQVRQEALLHGLEESARAAEVAHCETSQSAAILFQKLDAIAGDSAARLQAILQEVAISGIRIKPPVLVGPGILVTKTDDFILAIPQEEWRMAAFYAFWGTLEQGLTRRFRELVRPGMVVVDVGANIGIYTLHGARLTGPGGRVFSFEPTPRTFEVLKENVLTNGFGDRVQLFPMAVSNQNGQAPLYTQKGQCGWNSLFRYEDQADEPVMVETVCLDDALQSIDRIDILKIDAEGAEPFILRGMKRILRDNPQLTILLEFAPSHIKRAGVVPVDFVHQLTRIFDIQRVDDLSGESLPFDAGAVVDGFSSSLMLRRKGVE